MTMSVFPLLLAARLDWGFGNPNKTAALIAVLMVAAWTLAWLRPWGFWVSLAACAGLGVCLLLTASRGGLVAAVAGLACVLWSAPRPWPRTKMVVVAVALAGLTLYACQQATSSRYVHGIRTEDHSITNRLLIWKQVPRMILDAPTGWGFGNAGWAYMEWYQPIGHLEGYRTLVSSHLTWLVEGNWLVRVGYVLGWCAVFVLCWPDANNRWFSVGLGIWVAFWMGALFSSVAESPWTWVVPLYSLAPVLFARYEQQRCPSRRAWIGSVTSSSLMLVLLGAWMIGSVPAAQPIRGSARGVQVGAGTPAFWIVAPDPKIVGLHYGQELRRAQIAAAVVKHSADLPASASGAVVLAGRLPSAELISNCQQVLLLNPPAPPADAGAFLSTYASRQSVVVWGEFREDAGRGDWEKLARSSAAIRVMEAPGASHYLIHWGKLMKQAALVATATSPEHLVKRLEFSPNPKICLDPPAAG